MGVRRFRVLHLIKGLGLGGAERLLVDGFSYHDRARFDYQYAVLLEARREFVGDLERDGATVHCFEVQGSVGVVGAIPRLVRFLQQCKPDLIHAHLPLAAVSARIAAACLRIPVVYTEHGLSESYHPWTRRLNRLTWGLQSHVVAVSTEVAKSARSYCGDDVPVVVIPNGVEVKRIPTREPSLVAPARVSLGIQEGAFVVGTVASFKRQKRLDVWLRAARQIKDAIPNATFVLVGDGPLRPELEDLAASLGLTRSSILFAGLQRDVASYLTSFDVFMLSSDHEGLPIALLEAMAAQCAIVATSVGGIPEALGEELREWLVPPQNPEALALRVVALSDRTLRERLGTQARKRVEDRFGMRQMVSALERLYTEALEPEIASKRADSVTPGT